MKVVLLAICLYNLASAQINTAEYVAGSEYPIFPQRKDVLTPISQALFKKTC